MAGREFNIDPLLELQSLDKKRALARFEASEKDLRKKQKYEGLSGLDELENEATSPVTIYFKGDAFALGYIEGPSLAEGSKRDLIEALGEPEERLPSRGGKGSTICVYPAKGLAFSATGQMLEFLEVFPPTTLAKYKKDIYRKPPDFIK